LWISKDFEKEMKKVYVVVLLCALILVYSDCENVESDEEKNKIENELKIQSEVIQSKNNLQQNEGFSVKRRTLKPLNDLSTSNNNIVANLPNKNNLNTRRSYIDENGNTYNDILDDGDVGQVIYTDSDGKTHHKSIKNGKDDQEIIFGLSNEQTSKPMQNPLKNIENEWKTFSYLDEYGNVHVENIENSDKIIYLEPPSENKVTQEKPKSLSIDKDQDIEDIEKALEVLRKIINFANDFLSQMNFRRKRKNANNRNLLLRRNNFEQKNQLQSVTNDVAIKSRRRKLLEYDNEISKMMKKVARVTSLVKEMENLASHEMRETLL
jgi:hypothetical protein